MNLYKFLRKEVGVKLVANVKGGMIRVVILEPKH